MFNLFCDDGIYIVVLVGMMTVSAGRSIWRTHSQDGCTALICAARNGHSDCARLLLDAGADKETKCNVRASRSAASAVGRMCWMNDEYERLHISLVISPI